jgi:hypothetical protein
MVVLPPQYPLLNLLAVLLVSEALFIQILVVRRNMQVLEMEVVLSTRCMPPSLMDQVLPIALWEHLMVQPPCSAVLYHKTILGMFRPKALEAFNKSPLVRECLEGHNLSLPALEDSLKANNPF